MAFVDVRETISRTDPSRDASSACVARTCHGFSVDGDQHRERRLRRGPVAGGRAGRDAARDVSGGNGERFLVHDTDRSGSRNGATSVGGTATLLFKDGGLALNSGHVGGSLFKDAATRGADLHGRGARRIAPHAIGSGAGRGLPHGTLRARRDRMSGDSLASARTRSEGLGTLPQRLPVELGDRSAPDVGRRKFSSSKRLLWSGRRGSNPRQTAWEAATLPLSYARSGRLGIVAVTRRAEEELRTGGRRFATPVHSRSRPIRRPRTTAFAPPYERRAHPRPPFRGIRSPAAAFWSGVGQIHRVRMRVHESSRWRSMDRLGIRDLGTYRRAT